MKKKRNQTKGGLLVKRWKTGRRGKRSRGAPEDCSLDYKKKKASNSNTVGVRPGWTNDGKNESTGERSQSVPSEAWKTQCPKPSSDRGSLDTGREVSRKRAETHLSSLGEQEVVKKLFSCQIKSKPGKKPISLHPIPNLAGERTCWDSPAREVQMTSNLKGT